MLPWWVFSRTVWLNVTGIITLAGGAFLADPAVIAWITDHRVLVAGVGSLWGAFNIWLRGHPRTNEVPASPAEPPK